MRIDRGEAPTISTDPGETRPYDGPIRQNLYSSGQKVYTKQGQINFDRIFCKEVKDEKEESSLD